VQQYIIRRVLLNFLVIFLVATMVFLALRIDTSNVVRNAAGSCISGAIGQTNGLETCETITKAQLGLNHSLPVQYWTYMKKLVVGDLGRSFKSQNPVLGEIKQRVGPTIELGLLEILVAVIVALPIGIITAVRQDTWVDYILRFVSIGFLGIPIFVIALVSLIVTSRWAGGTFLPDWFGPHQTYYSLASDPWQNLKIMFAPAIIGGLGTGAVIMRFLRSQMLEVLRQDYVRTAWSKGLRADADRHSAGQHRQREHRAGDDLHHPRHWQLRCLRRGPESGLPGDPGNRHRRSYYACIHKSPGRCSLWLAGSAHPVQLMDN
jgi:peptide/nickel transport system permease protein